MRGVKVFATIVSNGMRLYLFASVKTDTSSNNNDDGETTSTTTLNLKSEWKIYLVFCIMSFLGATFGSSLRENVKKDVLLTLLYWLLWFTSLHLLGASSSGFFSLSAMISYLATCLISYFCWQCYFNTGKVERFIEGIGMWCKRGGKCCWWWCCRIVYSLVLL